MMLVLLVLPIPVKEPVGAGGFFDNFLGHFIIVVCNAYQIHACRLSRQRVGYGGAFYGGLDTESVNELTKIIVDDDISRAFHPEELQVEVGLGGIGVDDDIGTGVVVDEEGPLGVTTFGVDPNFQRSCARRVDVDGAFGRVGGGADAPWPVDAPFIAEAVGYRVDAVGETAVGLVIDDAFSLDGANNRRMTDAEIKIYECIASDSTWYDLLKVTALCVIDAVKCYLVASVDKDFFFVDGVDAEV